MVHRYIRYNGHTLTIQVSFTVNVCVCVGGEGGFESNGFVTKMQPFPMDNHFRTNVICSVGHPRSDLVMPLVLHTVCCAMAGAPALNYRSLGIASTLLRRGNISNRPYC
jgi:hypothetical protein